MKFSFVGFSTLNNPHCVSTARQIHCNYSATHIAYLTVRRALCSLCRHPDNQLAGISPGLIFKSPVRELYVGSHEFVTFKEYRGYAMWSKSSL